MLLYKQSCYFAVLSIKSNNNNKFMNFENNFTHKSYRMF